MPDYTFRLAGEADRPAVVAFMRAHWGAPHPIIEVPEFFDYYYAAPGGRLNIALCEAGGAIAALAGFIPASRAPKPDVWVSLWVADPAQKGSGLELMAQMPRLTGCRTLACNNIRPKTRAFYEFLGYATGRMGHFYRLADKATYSLAQIAEKDIPPVSGAAALTLLESAEELRQIGLEASIRANPYKDSWYLGRRYFHFPHQRYRLYAATNSAVDKTPFALLALRVIPVESANTAVLRIVDYIGSEADLPRLGTAIDRLMRECGAEYADFYCAGLAPETLRAAGFAERTEGSPNILPNYLNPPLLENTEYYYFTSRPEGFTMFKADGDQDRPNIVINN